MNDEFSVDPDIKKAKTLPSVFYTNKDVFDSVKQKVFWSSWQFAGDKGLVKEKKSVHPFVLLDDYLSEPMVLTRDEQGKLHCLSNVCTHRANLLALDSKLSNKLICSYHGRRFSLQGQFEHMPEFREALDFPRPCDHLKSYEIFEWGPLLFTGLNPKFDFQKIIEQMEKRVGYLNMDQFVYDQSLSKEYHVNAHWALYCDNYLEGFHIPYVHEELNQVIDYGNYSTELYEYCNLQIGHTDVATEIFDLPKEHPDEGKMVAAYYYWVFPNMMFNFYPWGLSLNIVQPIHSTKTKVSFLTYVYDRSKLGKGAGKELDTVEMEDEFVVENVQKGIRSSSYTTGRFSPKMEKGVHHFHRLLSAFLNSNNQV